MDLPTPSRTVTRSVDLDAGSAEVWSALTDPELLEDWLAAQAEIDVAGPDDRVRFRFEDGSVREGSITDAIERERLAFTWSRPGGESSRVEFRLDESESGTRLTVVETSLSATPSPRHAGPDALLSWGTKLESLRLCLASLAYA